MQKLMFGLMVLGAVGCADPSEVTAPPELDAATLDRTTRETFTCVEDSSGIICTSEELDLVAWCDYESGKCGGGCLVCY